MMGICSHTKFVKFTPFPKTEGKRQGPWGRGLGTGPFEFYMSSNPSSFPYTPSFSQTSIFTLSFYIDNICTYNARKP